MKQDLNRGGARNRYDGRRRDPSHWPRNNGASKKSRDAVKPVANSSGTAPTGGEPSTTIRRLVSDPNVSDKEARAAANCMVLHPACHDNSVEFYNLHGFWPDNLIRK